jgi:hypothetical protein
MYKRLILTSAIAAVTAQSHAATWVVGEVTAPIHTKQGIQALADTTGANIGNALVKLNTEYAQNDLVTFTLNMDKATNSVWPTSFEAVRSANLSTVEINTASNSGTSITVELTSTATTADNTGVVVGDQFTIGSTDTTTYRATAVNASGVLTITPTLASTATDGEALAFVDVKDMNFGLVSSTATSATYRVASLGNGTTTIGSLIPTPQMAVKEDGLQAAAATVAFSASTGAGTAMDALATTTTIGSAVDQYPIVLTSIFDATVDVEADKKAYVNNTASGSSTDNDIAKITIAPGTGTEGITADVNASGVLSTPAASSGIAAVTAGTDSVVHTITGDFSNLDNDTATAGIQTTDAAQYASTGTGCTVAFPTTGASVTLTDTLSDFCAVELIAPNTAVIPTQTFTMDSVFTFTPNTGSAATATTAGQALGSWALNGASITVYSMPFGAAVDQFLWVSNAGASAATVSGTVTQGGETWGPYTLETIAGKSTAKVSDDLATQLTAAGKTINFSRANITLTAPVKAADITVNASYKHIADADRLAVETSDTIDGTTK